MTNLHKEGLLSFDETGRGWRWDVEAIRRKGYTDNVADLMAGRLRRLPEAAREVLRVAACLGHTAELRVLAPACGRTEGEAEADLWPAVTEGLGDAIQFARYAPLVRAKGGRVLLECPEPLRTLFQTLSGVDELLPEGAGATKACDCHAPLMSLPRLLHTTLATVPADVPYLEADPTLVEQWRGRLASRGGFKVGVAWQGNPHHKWDRWRSVPLALFAPLAEVPGVSLVNLQQGPGSEQLPTLRGRFDVLDVGTELGAAPGAWANVAAVMACLDLVVSVDTATAHLAGALGVPVWVPLPTLVDWRWLLGREDSPWYPTMRLLRQKLLGDWEPVFQRMADALAKLARGE